MIDYIKENCELPPLEKPLYDEDSDTWDLYFEEKDNHNHWVLNETELISLPFETKEEAEDVFQQSMDVHHEQIKAEAERKAAKKNS